MGCVCVVRDDVLIFPLVPFPIPSKDPARITGLVRAHLKDQAFTVQVDTLDAAASDRSGTSRQSIISRLRGS